MMVKFVSCEEADRQRGESVFLDGRCVRAEDIRGQMSSESKTKQIH